MKFLNMLTAALISSMAASCCTSPKDTPLPRNLGGVDTTGFHAVFDTIYGKPCDELHSVLVIKDGKVVYEEYGPGHDADELHVLWSATKTFTATRVGFAVQDGLLSVDDKVVSFFDASELPEEPSDYLNQMTVKNLLTMSAGFDTDNINELKSIKNQTWAGATLANGFIFEPGQKFSYNSMESYLLSVIVSKVTGRTLVDYLNEKLFKPLGIRRYIYLTSPEGYNCGGWGLYLTSESLAKMGQFFLNKGSWNGRQLLNEEWIAEAMSCQVKQWQQSPDWTPEQDEQFKDNEWGRGYGYQMWCCTHDSFRLDGAWGQLVVIIPGKNAAVVYTSHTSGTGQLLDFTWNSILPNL